MATRMQQRRGTAAQWISTNSGNGPILNAGEIGYETDTNKFKIGDGTNHWINLDYFVDANSIANPSIGSSIVFEGTTENAYETTLFATDPTDDRTITLPDATGTVVLANASGDVSISGNFSVLGATTIIDSTILNVQTEVKFEGITANGFETSLKVVDPTADRVITFPDDNGNVILDTTSQTLTNKTIAIASNSISGSIGDFNTALTGADFATLAGTEILTNKTLTSPNINEGVALTATATELNVLDGITSSTAELNILDGVTSTAAELNILDGVTATAAQINVLGSLTASATELNILDGVVATTAELNYVNGVTSAIQSQLNNKQAVVANVSDTEIGYLDGVTSAIQTQIDAKAPLASPTFTGVVTLPANTISQSMMSDDSVGTNEIGGLAVTNAKIANNAITAEKIDSGAVTSAKIANDTIMNVDINSAAAIDWTKLAISSTVSSTELGYLDGVTSAIQTQIDAKAPLAGPTFTGTVNAANITLSGNLTVNGTTTTVSSTNLEITDPLIYIGTGNSANANDLGVVGHFDNGTYQHTGIVRDATDGKWKLFSGVTTEPSGTIDFTTWTKDSLVVGALEATTVTPSSGVVFSDGTQTKEGTPSRTPIIQKTASYTLSSLTERDSLVEVASSSGTTITIPTNTAVAYPVGTSIDILQTSTGQVTIAGDTGVTVNATPGLKLRAQWSSCTLFKRATDTWIVMGDLSA